MRTRPGTSDPTSVPRNVRRAALIAAVLASSLGLGTGCGEDGSIGGPGLPGIPGLRGKADGIDAPSADSVALAARRQVEVVFTEPHCDICTAEDKTALVARSKIVAHVVALINEAQTTLEAANFTFSVKDIEAALVAAHQRGVNVRLAIDKGQAQADSVATRLQTAGIPLQFVEGSPSPGPDRPAGLQHAKFLVADGKNLLTGSNNWSSTGTSINEESNIIIRSDAQDPLINGFRCHFEAMFRLDLKGAQACSGEGFAFTPGTGAIKLIRNEIRAATRTIDVLMHHFLLTDLVKDLAAAAERGVKVRVVINLANRDEAKGPAWDRLAAAGGRIRYKQTNGDLFQIMHHKLAVFDDRVLVNGSGNWSGSAFFNNYENYVRYDDARIVRPYREQYTRLWDWSLDGASADAGITASQQHAARTRIFFGNLHAHIHAGDGAKVWDDGKAELHGPDGTVTPVIVPPSPGEAARQAFEYARDRGQMDFLVLTPHTVDDRPGQATDPDLPSTAYEEMQGAAQAVTLASQGKFLALNGAEWSTNSDGNHVNVFGSRDLPKIPRGEFRSLYEQYLPGRGLAGDRVVLQLNHPRTFAEGEGRLEGSWDQLFDVPLTMIPKASERQKKFNDFGLDEYPPLSDVRQSWIDGAVLPDREVVRQTMTNLEWVTRPYVRLMEVLVGRGTDIAGENHENPSMSVDPATGILGRRTHVHDDWDYYLRHGFRLAPTGNHDNHYPNWGTGHSSRTAVVAEELTEETLLAALENRAVYASEDENLQVRFYAEGRAPMGSKLGTLKDTVSLEAQVIDPDAQGPFVVRVYRGTIGGASVDVAEELTLEGGAWKNFEVQLPAAGEHFVYLEVHAQDTDRQAFSAPIWVERL